MGRPGAEESIYYRAKGGNSWVLLRSYETFNHEYRQRAIGPNNKITLYERKWRHEAGSPRKSLIQILLGRELPPIVPPRGTKASPKGGRGRLKNERVRNRSPELRPHYDCEIRWGRTFPVPRWINPRERRLERPPTRGSEAVIHFRGRAHGGRPRGRRGIPRSARAARRLSDREMLTCVNHCPGDSTGETLSAGGRGAGSHPSRGTPSRVY